MLNENFAISQNSAYYHMVGTISYYLLQYAFVESIKHILWPTDYEIIYEFHFEIDSNQ